MGGFLPITHQEMLAFAQLRQIYLSPVDIEVITTCDRAFMEVQAEQMKKEQKKHENKSKKK